MDWLEFVASVIKSLSWPTVILVVLILFRGQLTDLIPLLRRIKYKDLEVEFERTLAQATERARRDVLSPARPSVADRYVNTLERLVSIADASPRAAILEAWLEVETAAFDVAVRFSLAPTAHSVSPLRLGEVLTQFGGMSPDVLEVYKQLWDLRNKAVHAVDAVFGPMVVRDYVSLAISVADYLRRQSPSISE